MTDSMDVSWPCGCDLHIAPVHVVCACVLYVSAHMRVCVIKACIKPEQK